MKSRWQKKSLQQTMMYGFGALFAVSLLAFLLFFLRSYQEELQTEIEHMEEYNEQLTINLDSTLNSTESFLYLHFQMIKSAIFCVVMTVILMRKVRKLQKIT